MGGDDLAGVVIAIEMIAVIGLFLQNRHLGSVVRKQSEEIVVLEAQVSRLEAMCGGAPDLAVATAQADGGRSAT